MQRALYESRINEAFRIHSIVAILGPRQCGKTTLAQTFGKSFLGTVHTFDLENPRDLARLQNPFMALEEKEGLIVIDEIQRKPELFPVLRVLADDKTRKRQFLILGSASRELIRQSSESLAGRIEYIELTPFSLVETGELKTLWTRGGFPKSYLSQDIQQSQQWRNAYISTFLEQDIPALGISIPANTLRRFWTMLAHCHGNILNLSELGASFGASHTTMRNYLDILCGTFMIRELKPWYENISKRQVKSPKVYFRDSGLLHSLLNIVDFDDLESNPKLGASWEGFALEEIVRRTRAANHECYFWRTHAGAELDLLIHQQGKRVGFEFKYTDFPKVTSSMQIALNELNLDRLWVITPKAETAPLADKIRMISLQGFCNEPELAPRS